MVGGEGEGRCGEEGGGDAAATAGPGVGLAVGAGALVEDGGVDFGGDEVARGG